MGATLYTFPAFSLVPTNAMVESPHGRPHLFPFVAVYPGAFRPGASEEEDCTRLCGMPIRDGFLYFLV